MYQLCLTLGHNSSAILIHNEKIVCGYENERLSGIKADSQFPELAIEECLHYCNKKDIDHIYVSHWSTDGQIETMSAKHYNPFYFGIIFPHSTIHTLTKDFTHHDAHFWSARCFAKEIIDKNTLTIVADGFGNFGETMSIYVGETLTRRVFGFNTSLGLLYQYATAYLELKMNQDEYKLLGYGAHISDYLTYTEMDVLYREIHIWVDKFYKKMFLSLPAIKYDPVCSIDSLPALRLHYQEKFDGLLSKFHFTINDITKKVIISFFVQSVVEKVITNIVNMRYNGTDSVVLVGGLFLNVKLNNKILELVKNICVMPLCGDQGAALGMYYYDHPDFEIKDLYWGKRAIDIEALDKEIRVIANNPITIKSEFTRLLDSGYIVNVVHGPMEFGPRALCNTSTLAMPTIENVKYINRVNSRDQIMPMGPVITDPEVFFPVRDIMKIHRSLEFMVIAVNYDCHVSDNIKGVTHFYEGFTGRPQVINKHHILYDVANIYEVLINTSFNIHGTPIVFNAQQINHAHKEQRKLDIEDRIVTIYIKD